MIIIVVALSFGNAIEIGFFFNDFDANHDSVSACFVCRSASAASAYNTCSFSGSYAVWAKP